MKRFGYKSARLPFKSDSLDMDTVRAERDIWLNNFGIEGWEAINIIYGTDGLYVIFKRELQ